ncbi:hypothetical protein CGC58_01340 [Capnocytophaga stomatis]|uniref:YcxB-like protein domain-containing protein n=1 Tax=Capnocytophaga stomatis TaxID=1848904 RepID=A0A250FX09_9FLAO|nr:hypothetical protein [Capnocytophaga stomatis]ATA88497.1 hypothetical protein CGC58_01340 [Capnocytophaga stomatis]
MKNQKIAMDSFNVKYSFWASIITIFILFPMALLVLKWGNIKNTGSQTQLIILLLSMTFGFLIVIMKSTMKKVYFIKSDENILIKDKHHTEIKLDKNFNYNLYNYNSKKAFMIRISDENKSYFYLSPNMHLKSDIEAFFPASNKKKIRMDFYAQYFQ